MTRILVALLFLIGLSIPVGVLGGGLAGLIVTFFGLVAAGVLSAITLLVANVLTPSLSIAQLNRLKHTVDQLVDRLLAILGLVFLGAGAVMIQQAGSFQLPVPSLPLDASDAMRTAASYVPELPQRILQATVFTSTAIVADRLRLLAHAFREVLDARYKVSLSDSQKRLKHAAPNGDDIALAFSTPQGFGAKVDLEASLLEDK